MRLISEDEKGLEQFEAASIDHKINIYCLCTCGDVVEGLYTP